VEAVFYDSSTTKPPKQQVKPGNDGESVTRT